MKKILVLLLIVATVPALAADSVNAKISKVFAETFPGALNVTWNTTKESSEVYYELAGVKCHIWYDAQGRVLKTRRYYSEKELCPFLKAKISRKYADKKIFGVTEINDENELTYVIILEDATSWTHLKTDATGHLSVTNKFRKAGS